MKAHQFSALLLFACALSSCVVGPDYQKPRLSMPKTWNAKAHDSLDKPPVLAEWWKQMKDPILDDLIAQAVASNLDVATAKAKIREARATYREQVGALLPTIEGTASATRNRSAASNGTSATVYNDYQAGFDASWELDLFGGNKRTAEASKYGVDAANEDLRNTLVTLIGDVATYYIQAREYQQLTELARNSSKSQGQTAALTRTQFSAGGVSLVDVTKVEAQAASTHADIPSYEISYAKSLNRLGVLLGRSPLLLDSLLGKRSRLPIPPSRVSVGIPADLLNSRPDVRKAERELAQATAKIGAAEANRYPSLSLTGSIDSSAASVSELGKNSTIGWSFGPSLTIPIFQGGQLKAAVDVAKAQRDQYLFSYQSAVLSAMEDVQNAIVSLNRSRARSVDLAKAVQGYSAAAKLSKQLNIAGEGDLFDVLDADRSLYSAQQNLIETNTDIATYYVSLNKALGGGWAGRIDISQPAVGDTNEAPHIQVKQRAQ
ncbi:RND transporter [Rhizobium tubonense]|uniref:RND transporter n=2 Tax=Rhizobium tubonense TaxID=484088 RepID=A0A2W4D0M5_9HYPH|nr:efflux transporter outer membrane subunit [Rhizobium tubonense]PZM16498.1 RND transporter [Rhizobium tubonense]